MTPPPTHASHLHYLAQTLNLARSSPPKPTNFRVGAVLVAFPAHFPPKVLSTGFTLELEGNTHAEQCALSKLASKHSISEDQLNEVLAPELQTVLYTSLEPCALRLSGNKTCVARIIATRQPNAEGGIRKVVFGAKEPGTFVKDSKACQLLDQAGVEWEYVADLEEEVLKVAMEGHESKEEKKEEQEEQSTGKENKGTNVDEISVEERKRQEALPRNPKKRMMEVDVSGQSSG